MVIVLLFTLILYASKLSLSSPVASIIAFSTKDSVLTEVFKPVAILMYSAKNSALRFILSFPSG